MTRPVIAPRALLGWLAVAAVAAALVLVPARGSTGLESDPRVEPDPAQESAQGGTLYAQYCAVCHGMNGEGVEGTGVRAGPPVNTVDVAYHDLLLRTGRMPIVAESLGITDEPNLDDDTRREALVAWMAETFDLPGTIPDVGDGDVARGHELYSTYCAQCHGATGVGGISADGTVVRRVRGLDPVATVEAVRVGPFQMPAFDEEVLSEQDAADVAAFVAAMPSSAPPTPLGLGEINRVTMAVLALVLVGVVIGVVFLAPAPVRALLSGKEATDDQ